MSSAIKPEGIGTHLNWEDLARFVPEPTSKSGTSFPDILGGILGIAGRLAGASGGMGQFPGLDSTYTNIMNAQLEVQKQMQLMTMYSNIEKSKHETKMTALRNIRVG